MNVNDKFFSFPPHLSISWIHVAALSSNTQGQLTFHLISGETTEIPSLSAEETKSIFCCHARFLENQILNEPVLKPQRNENETPIRFALGSMDATAAQHNPAQKNAPNLPFDILNKFTEVAKIMGPADPEALPKAEPHCNCFYCQIARAISGEADTVAIEEVSIEELQFEQWEITQTGEKLFNVSNKLDQLENYSVHLGSPVGCTCGKQNCEHILAVLKS